MAGNIIPQSRMDPVGVKVASLFPDPTLPGLASNWYAASKAIYTEDHFDTRFDYQPTEKDSLFFRYSEEPRATYVTPDYVAWGIAATGDATQNHRGQTVLGNTFIFSPTFVLTANLSYQFWEEQDIPTVRANPTVLGWSAAETALWQASAGNVLPKVTPTGYASLGGPNYMDHPQGTKAVTVDASKSVGSHTFKFGSSMQFGFSDGPGTYGSIGSAKFNFDYQQTNSNNVSGSNLTGNPIASMLFGVGASGSNSTLPVEAGRHKVYSFYAQDTWQPSRKLTVNYGLRYELQMPISDKYGRFSTFDFGGPSALVVPGMNLQGGVVWESKYAWAPDYLDFAPRASVAYKFTDKLVLRVGYGIFFVPTLGNGSEIGYSATTQWLTQNPDGSPLNPISNPFPSGNVAIPGKTLGGLTGIGGDVPVVLRHFPNGYVENYSADFQYEIGHGFLAELGYSGNGGRKLIWGQGGNSGSAS